MNVSNNRLPGGVSIRTIWMSIALVVIVLALSACSGGSTSNNSTDPVAAAACDPADPGTAGECGTLIIGLTDGDGDFLSYSVDVLSLLLEKADGTAIEVLPNSTFRSPTGPSAVPGFLSRWDCS